MSSQVEARSLADLNFLAANPPRYPVNPAEDPRESLVLYISRVPGTSDVILSTAKPQKKNVTGEDIATPLYYVHLDSPSDELLAPPVRPPADDPSPRSSLESSRSAIPRKPLPPATSVSSTAVPHVPKLLIPQSAVAAGPASAPGFMPVAPSPRLDRYGPGSSDFPREEERERTAVVSRDGYTANPMFRTSRQYHTAELPELPPRSPPKPTSGTGAAVARKPLGPRPLEAPHPVGRDAEMHLESSYQSNDRHAAEPRLSPALVHADLAVRPAHIPTTAPYLPAVPSLSVQGDQRITVMAFSLTIIRRDPSSGVQWNVGKVSSPQTYPPTRGQIERELDAQELGQLGPKPNIDIHLETSGYVKFRGGMPNRYDVDAAKRSIGTSSGHAAIPRHGVEDGGPPGQWQSHKAQIDEGFSRQVAMVYSKSFASNLKQAFRRRGSSVNSNDSSHDELAPPKPFRPGHASSHSVASIESTGSMEMDERDPQALITQPGPGLKPRGYVFMSPWDGRCEFQTGNGGKSLKCRHKLPSHDDGFNPLVVTQALRDGQAFNRARNSSVSAVVTGSKPVSELRFNLPSGGLFAPSKKDGTRHFHDRFHKLLNLEDDSSDEEEEDAPMDLSLGREKAGGGNRGKRAKLGKLIIHDEGLKMLDLVVAANIGVWWTTWERAF